MRYAKYGPMVISILVAAVLAFRNAFDDNVFSLEDRYVVAIAVVNAVVTILVPNLSEGINRFLKPLTHAALVALAFFVKAQTGDGLISVNEWIDGIVLAVGALGVIYTVGPVWNARTIEGETVSTSRAH